jgi:hypothetical protein
MKRPFSTSAAPEASDAAEDAVSEAFLHVLPKWRLGQVDEDSASLVIAENCSLYLVSGDGSSREELSTAGSCAEDPAWTA